MPGILAVALVLRKPAKDRRTLAPTVLPARLGLVKLLFVCLGNICRSPAAEGVLARLVADAGVGELWTIDSAGTLGLHAGDLPDHRMRAAAKRRGYPLESRARQVRREDFSQFDLILAMDRQNRSDLERVAGPSGTGGRLALFGDFCVRHDIDDVPDPYYGGPEGFEHVLDLLEDGCAEILRRWQEEGAWRG